VYTMRVNTPAMLLGLLGRVDEWINAFRRRRRHIPYREKLGVGERVRR